MILSCTGLGKAAISGLSRSSTALSALHTRLTAFYAECTSFWYVNFASEMKVFGLVGGVRVCVWLCLKLISTVNTTGINNKQPTIHLRL